jgi:ABC-type iron transport system FetAB permease component
MYVAPRLSLHLLGQFNASNISQDIIPRSDQPAISQSFVRTPLSSVIGDAQAAALSVVSQAEATASAAATIVPPLASSVAGEAQAAASSAVTQAQGAMDAAASKIPRNLTLGTKYYCVGFVNHTDCHLLPLNLSEILPAAVAQYHSLLSPYNLG